MNPKVCLHVQDPALRTTLSVIYKVAGFRVSDLTPAVLVTDDLFEARQTAASIPTLLLTPVSAISEAVNAMKEGVLGYIMLPLVGEEAVLMVKRALALAPLSDSPLEKDDALDVMEKKHILKVLKSCKGNQTRAAKRLGIGRNTLWRKLNRYSEENQEPTRE
ncbi:MAG: hypothetical protein GX117_01155 [Candidatus Hydrogenedentes bacterium]|jgi:DNA-binding NtrC family response regulator|nr:hypothetical protein [Candidatus Hydrogenedentota bacterium]